MKFEKKIIDADICIYILQNLINIYINRLCIIL